MGFLSTKRNRAILVWMPLLEKKKKTKTPPNIYERNSQCLFALKQSDFINSVPVISLLQTNSLETRRQNTEKIKWPLYKCLFPTTQTGSCSHRYFVKLLPQLVWWRITLAFLSVCGRFPEFDIGTHTDALLWKGTGQEHLNISYISHSFQALEQQIKCNKALGEKEFSTAVLLWCHYVVVCTSAYYVTELCSWSRKQLWTAGIFYSNFCCRVIQ